MLVAWGGRLSAISVRLSGPIPKILEAKLVLENSGTRSLHWDGPGQFSIKAPQSKGSTVYTYNLPIKGRLPFGYHRLTLDIRNVQVSTVIISAPRKAPESGPTRRWGIFSPLYALHSKSSCGAGNLSDFFKLAQWSASLGSTVIATLPLLPGFYKEHFDPSPYSPVSRLYWNEFFIDIASVPELALCPEAANLLGSYEYNAEISKLQSEPLVDYARQMTLKRRILELLAGCFFNMAESQSRRRSFSQYLENKPDVKHYARFRAASEFLKIPWTEWPERVRNGCTDTPDYDPEVERYYLYTQFLAHEQMADVSSKVKSLGQSLYLDVPLGANPDGYDIWKNQVVFARGSSVGAPPDPAFPNGQDWGFPPIHPERLRESGYRYFIDVIRHHLQFAGILRLDHIMGLHRLYWIPNGSSPNEGIYVRYEAEEMYAILCLEAHKAGAVIVGEDLGIVPEAVRWSMRRHNIYRSYVAQYEMLTGNDNCLEAIPVHAVAAINTHDMHPFAAFWLGTDIGERKACGVLTPDRAELEINKRTAGKQALSTCLEKRNLLRPKMPSSTDVHRAICRVIAASDVEVMLLSIDDLSGSTEAQNIPGTCSEHPNWRQRATKSLEQLEGDEDIGAFLEEIDLNRRRINL